MLTCPLCKKSVAEAYSACPHCRTDLSILVDYVSHLHEGLERANALTRAGNLGDAVWAYLEVLEVDPDNAEARRQVTRVATAVRQFDRAALGRRWLERLRRQARLRHWLARWQESAASGWGGTIVAAVLIGLALAAGYWLGSHATAAPAAATDR